MTRICCILTLIWNLLKNRQLSELLKVFDWLNANKLTLNAKKSNYVIFRPYQCKFNYSVNIVLIDNCTQIITTPHCKDLVKCLGVLLDSIFLSWKFHINNVALKVNRTVELLPSLALRPTYNLFKYLSIIDIALSDIRFADLRSSCQNPFTKHSRASKTSPPFDVFFWTQSPCCGFIYFLKNSTLTDVICWKGIFYNVWCFLHECSV